MNYSFSDIDGKTIFRTGSFSTEKGSVLHSGIYNRELTSSISSGALLVLALMLFSQHIKMELSVVFGLLVLFVGLFLAFRFFVFKDPVLVVCIDKVAGCLTVTRDFGLFKKKETFDLKDVVAIKRDYLSSLPSNPDGVKVVENIALQHFTVIPGFGQPTEFHTVVLTSKDGDQVVLFSSKDEKEADEVRDRLWSALS